MNKWAKTGSVLIGVAGLTAWLVYAKLQPATIATSTATEPSVPRSAQPILPAIATVPEIPNPQEVIAQFARAGTPKLSPAQIESFLKDKDRSADALLVAFRLSQDPAYLREAAKSFPDQPAVQLVVALRAPTTEERQQGIDAFKKLSPENPIGPYLQADLSFSQGDYARAAQGLSETLPSGNLPDPSGALFKNTEAAYLVAGYSPIESKIAALFLINQDRTLFLSSLQNVSGNLTQLREQFIQQGDIDAAEPTVELGLTLGQRIQNQVNPALLNALVGQAIERQTLEALDPSTPLGTNNETAQSRLAQLDTLGQEVNGLLLALQSHPVESMSSEEINQYTRRVQQDGEISALTWWIDLKSATNK